MTKLGAAPSALLPKAAKKTLSYMTRLCQPSSRLFQYVDNSARSPAWDASINRAWPARRERLIGGRTRLTFPDLWMGCAGAALAAAYANRRYPTQSSSR